MPLRDVLVLLVEDNPDHRELGRVLLTHSAARVAVAEDGERGLEQMRQERPDLVLCDLKMPHMDGYEFARRVRRIPNWARVRLVALTSFHDDTAYLRTWSEGFDAHLEKPITLEKLDAIAERLGISGKPVSLAAKRAGVPPRHEANQARPKPSPVDSEPRKGARTIAPTRGRSPRR